MKFVDKIRDKIAIKSQVYKGLVDKYSMMRERVRLLTEDNQTMQQSIAHIATRLSKMKLCVNTEGHMTHVAVSFDSGMLHHCFSGIADKEMLAVLGHKIGYNVACLLKKEADRC